MERDFLLMQLNDSYFPVGSYAHSYGLETYIQKNLVCDEKTAENYIVQKTGHGFLYGELLTAKLAWEAASEKNMGALLHLNEIIESSKIASEILDASRKTGARFIKTIGGMEILREHDFFQSYCRQSEKRYYYEVVYGVVCACSGINCRKAAKRYLYAQASAMATNCVKLIPLSQISGQKILNACIATFEEILNILPTLSEDDLFLSTPGFDIRCMQHEGLYSRLYMS